MKLLNDGPQEKMCYSIFKRGSNSKIAHIWKAYLTLEIVKQDKCPKYNESITVSSKIQ
jgi:hypothetical protein